MIITSILISSLICAALELALTANIWIEKVGGRASAQAGTIANKAKRVIAQACRVVTCLAKVLFHYLVHRISHLNSFLDMFINEMFGKLEHTATPSVTGLVHGTTNGIELDVSVY